MDKETLSNYGWIVICVLVLAVMIALATPFGTFVSDAVKSTTQGLFDVNRTALNSTNLITMDDQSFDLKSYGIIAPEIVTQADQAVFRSEADIDKFVEVKVDGNVVDEANYTVTEGSTIITFTPEYTKTLENGNHTIEIVSNDGSASCEFSVDISQVVGSATFSKYLTNPGCHEIGQSHDSSCFTNEEKTLTWDELKDPANGKKYNYDASKITDTEIGDNAFAYCSLIKLTIPHGVTTIGEYAISRRGLNTWHSFESIGPVGSGADLEIPSSVTTIGDNAFDFCGRIKSVILPEGIVTIGDKVFYECHSLESIDLSGCTNLTTIGADTFTYCESLESIDLSGCTSLTTIGGNAFYVCYNLKSIDLSGCTSLTTIGDNAFYGSYIESITLPSSLTTIGNNAFYCQKLTSITFGNTKAQWNAISKTWSWNYSCPEITLTCTDGTIIIPAGLYD